MLFSKEQGVAKIRRGRRFCFSHRPQNWGRAHEGQGTGIERSSEGAAEIFVLHRILGKIVSILGLSKSFQGVKLALGR